MTDGFPRELISAIQEGRAALFLGAGASRGALHPSGDPMPDGRALAVALAEAFLGTDYTDLDFRTAYDLCCSMRDVRTVQRRVFEILNPFQPADFHELIPKFSWAGIATTNYDQIIERAYKRASERVQTLVPNLKDGDGAADSIGDKGLLYVKLHGCITKYQEVDPPFIASTEQLISYRTGRVGQFDTFLEWAKTRTLIFCGFAFLDSNLRILYDEIVKEGDKRPRHYIINKGLREAEIAYWRERRAIALDMPFQEFLQLLAQEIPKNKRALGVAAAATEHTSFSKFITTSKARESDDLRHYLSSFIEHIGANIDPPPGDPKRFYSGFDLGWFPIAADLDVRQSIIDDVLTEHVVAPAPAARQALVVIKGHAGSGKSVVLRRLCYEAATRHGKLCFFISRQHILQVDRLSEIFQLTNIPIFLFVDNIADHRDAVVDLLSAAKAQKITLTIIGAETHYAWNTQCDELDPLVVQAFEMRYLSEPNIETLLAKLETHDALGYLKALRPEQRVHELKYVHGRQLLVALLEATHGAPLVELIAQEYRSISSDEARLLYLDICSLHRFGPPVRAGLISRIHNITFNEFRERLFKPLQNIVSLREDKRSGDYVYEARHSFIANTVYEAAVKTTAERFDNIVRVINKLNPNYSYDLEVLGKLIKADTLEKTLRDHAKIRQVFDVAEDCLGTSSLLLHQQGLFEMHVANNQGGLTAAEDLLTQALEFEPYNRAIKHSLAEINLKRSRLASDKLERRAWRGKAVEQAGALLKGNSPYPHHTLLKASVDAVRDALAAAEAEETEVNTRALGETIAGAEEVLKRGLQAFPNEALLLKEEGELSAVLSEAVRAERAFEKAFEANPRSTLVARRLARIKRAKETYTDAAQILQKCLGFNPGSQELHYDLALVTIESAPDADQTENETVLYHLKRSFSSGDKNRQAQFWYARQLCISDNYEDARPIFRALADARLPFREKKEVRAPIRQSDSLARVYQGTISSIRGQFGFIRCDSPTLSAYFSTTDLGDLAELVSVGDTISFNIAFNLMGPVAINLQI